MNIDSSSIDTDTVDLAPVKKKRRRWMPYAAVVAVAAIALTAYFSTRSSDTTTLIGSDAKSHRSTGGEILARNAARCKRIPACDWYNTSGIAPVLSKTAKDLGELYKDKLGGNADPDKSLADAYELKQDVVALATGDNGSWSHSPYPGYNVPLDNLMDAAAQPYYLMQNEPDAAFQAADQARTAFIQVSQYRQKVYAEGAS